MTSDERRCMIITVRKAEQFRLQCLSKLVQRRGRPDHRLFCDSTVERESAPSTLLTILLFIRPFGEIIRRIVLFAKNCIQMRKINIKSCSIELK